jgi:hypothetical protein
MKTTMKCLLVVLAIGALGGCETLREQTQVRGVDVLSSGGSSTGTDEAPQPDCQACRRKWSARPDGGVNGPPWIGI